MFSFVVNAFAVLVGSALGLLFKKVIKKDYCDSVLKAIGVVVILLGITGVIDSTKDVEYSMIIIILCIGIGTFIGEVLKLENFVNNKALYLEKKLNKGKISEGLITSSILMCVGALTIIGSLQSALGDPSTIYVKSILDFVSSIVLASTLGFGVMLSSVTVFVVQGLMTLLFYLFRSGTNQENINLFATYISMVGYVMVTSIGLNLLISNKIKTINMLPSLLLVIIYTIIKIYL